MKPSLIFDKVIHTVLDCLFCWLSWMGAIWVFSYLGVVTNPPLVFADAHVHVWIMIAACVVFYSICGVYKSLWKHPGIGSVLRIATAVFLASFAVYVSLRVRMGFWSNPGYGVMAFYFLFSLSLALRIRGKVLTTLIMYFHRLFRNPLNIPNLSQEPIKTLLVGAGESASAFLLHKSQHGSRPREVLGIVDNDFRKHGYSLHGVNILGDDSNIPQLVKQFDIDEIVIAVPSMNNENLRRIITLTPTNRCKVRLLMGLSSDKVSDRLRDVNIGDLLGRAENVPDLKTIGAWLKGKTVLITGGGGSIGGEICRQLLKFDAERIVIFDNSENNAFNLKDELKTNFGNKGLYKVSVRIGSVQDEQRLNEVFDEVKPNIVFHAAAYKHVPLMEQCPRLALENNTFGTYQTAKCACKHGVERFVMISTDKAVNPTSVMGASKRLAELVVLGMNHQKSSSHKRTEFVCVRFGNVLESNGSVIPTFKRQIEVGGPITLTHPDMIRYFMTMPEAARLVIEAGAMANGGEIFILDMGAPVKIMDLAENLIRMAGLTPGVDIKIEISGLRPGEKLYEELILNEEGLTKTFNDKIFVVKPPPPSNYLALEKHLTEHMKSYADNGEGVRRVFKQFIPEYAYTSRLSE